MRKRRWVLILVICLAAAGLTFLCLRSTEPRYQGRSLSSWLRLQYMVRGAPEDPRLPETQEKRQRFIEAIRHMGPDAVPWLVRWIQYEPPSWKAKVRRTLTALHLPLDGRWFPHRFMEGDQESRASQACLSFSILGPAARAAAPELARVARAKAGKDAALRATHALIDIGPDSLPQLTGLLTSTSAEVRQIAVHGIAKFGTEALPALPALANCLRDKEPLVAQGAAIALGELRLQPAGSVLALIDALEDPRPEVRAAAVYSISRFALDARQAVPALLRVSVDVNADVRRMVTNALLQLSPEVLTNAPSSNL